MKSFIKSLLPPQLRDAIRIVKSHHRSVSTNIELKRRFDPDTFPIDLSQCRIFPTRIDLLSMMPVGGTVVEVGVATGDFSKEIRRVCQPDRLILIDIWNQRETVSGKIGGSVGYEAVCQLFRDEITSGTVEIKKGFSTEKLGELANQSVEWLYIDAAHDYDNVFADLEAALPKVKPGGFIAGHDYTRWGSNGLSRFGVVEAVNQFCLKHKLTFSALSNEPHRHISYALRLT